MVWWANCVSVCGVVATYMSPALCVHTVQGGGGFAWVPGLINWVPHTERRHGHVQHAELVHC